MVLTGCSTSTRSTTNRNCYQFLTGPHTIISRGYSIILILHQSRLLIPLKWLFPSHALSISHSQHLWTGTCLIWPPHPVHSHRIKKNWMYFCGNMPYQHISIEITSQQHQDIIVDVWRQKQSSRAGSGTGEPSGENNKRYQ